MSEEMAVRYMSLVPDDIAAEDNDVTNEMSNDQMYCQADDEFQVIRESLHAWPIFAL